MPLTPLKSVESEPAGSRRGQPARHGGLRGGMRTWGGASVGSSDETASGLASTPSDFAEDNPGYYDSLSIEDVEEGGGSGLGRWVAGVLRTHLVGPFGAAGVRLWAACAFCHPVSVGQMAAETMRRGTSDPRASVAWGSCMVYVVQLVPVIVGFLLMEGTIIMARALVTAEDPSWVGRDDSRLVLRKLLSMPVSEKLEARVRKQMRHSRLLMAIGGVANVASLTKSYALYNSDLSTTLLFVVHLVTLLPIFFIVSGWCARLTLLRLSLACLLPSLGLIRLAAAEQAYVAPSSLPDCRRPYRAAHSADTRSWTAWKA